jgi:WD40 repeat protein
VRRMCLVSTLRYNLIVDYWSLPQSSNKNAGDNKSLAVLTGSSDGHDGVKAIFESPKFKHALMAAERIIIQNIYHDKQVMYREPPPPDPASESKGRGAKLEQLFTFKCGLTEGRTVTCMSWNKLNPDLLAVGYGNFDFSRQGDGLVLFWSVKNPEYPQKVYRTECSVTALAFGNHSANLLAVGLYDGTVGVRLSRPPCWQSAASRTLVLCLS